MKTKALVITIDGPAGAGKSSVSKALAQRLGYLYLDTGALYRALALKALKERVDLNDEDALARLCKLTDVDLRLLDGDLTVLLDGVAVESMIRTEEVGKAASKISTFDIVRKKLLDLQRSAGAGGGVVAEGRDMGTIVFPDADFKFYLDADIEERTRRRHLELANKNSGAGIEAVSRELQARDKQDSGRKIAPLRRSPDATVIDSTNLSIDQVVDEILKKMHLNFRSMPK